MENYEQKYKEALKMAKVAALNGHQNLMEGIFPELKESEDEKIRKEIIAVLQYKYEKFPKDPKYCNTPQWLAWLEKQGEQKPFDYENATIMSKDFAPKVEQKSAWSEEDERAFHHVLSVLEEYGEEHPSNSKFVCNWLKSIKARMEGDKV